MAITIEGGIALGGGISFSGGIGDPYWSSVSLLLPGQSFADAGPLNLAITNNGATISSAQTLFGSSTMNFNGSNFLSMASNAAFNIFGGDMTVECWFRANSLASSPHLFAFVLNDGNRESIYFNGGALTFWSSNGDGNGPRIATSALSTNVWYYCALVKSGSTFTMYLNGTAVGTSTTTQYSTANQSLQIGTYNSGLFGGDNFNGYISNLRITKGVARYTSNFSVPTEPFPIG